MSWFKKLFGGADQPPYQPPEYPPRPSDWCKTLDDLTREMDEGKRKSIGQPEIGWARDYMRSLIPPEARFPQKGDVYREIKDLEVTYMTSWTTSFTGGGKATIKEGERFWVNSDPVDDEPTGTYALAVDYDELEERIVDASERSNPKYAGFYFHFDTVDLNRDFELFETGYTNEGEQSAAQNP